MKTTIIKSVEKHTNRHTKKPTIKNTKKIAEKKIDKCPDCYRCHGNNTKWNRWTKAPVPRHKFKCMDEKCKAYMTLGVNKPKFPEYCESISFLLDFFSISRVIIAEILNTSESNIANWINRMKENLEKRKCSMEINAVLITKSLYYRFDNDNCSDTDRIAFALKRGKIEIMYASMDKETITRLNMALHATKKENILAPFKNPEESKIIDCSRQYEEAG